MGKIADALNKYSKERSSVQVQKATRDDLEALMTYDRETGHLLKYNKESGEVDHRSMDVLRNRGTIQRLLDNNLIMSGGKVTPEGIAEVKRLEKSKKAPQHAAPTALKPVGLENTKVTMPRKAVDFEKELTDFEQFFKTDEFHGPEPAVEERTIKLRPGEEKTAQTGPVLVKEALPQTQSQQPEELKSLGSGEDETHIPNEALTAIPLTGKDADKKVVEKSPPAKIARSTYSPTAIDRNLISLLEPQSYEAEQFKILRTNILYPLSGKPPRSILVTSALPEEGKSFVASNLAISIALNINKHVLLMDCDLRKPELHQRFGFQQTPGLSNYLADEIPLTSLLLKTEVHKLTILPGGPPPQNPSELMSSERMEALIEEVMNRYNDRLIVIDSPPPSMAAETGVLSRQVDGIVLVVKSCKTPKDQVGDVIDIVGADKIIGSVINYIDSSSSKHYGYGKYGKYGKKYKK